MSDVEVEKITDSAGTGAPNFTYGLNSGGSDSGLLGFAYTASGTEPSSPANGDVWFDTANDKYYTYINGEFKQLTHVNPSTVWYGDRGVFAGGYNNSILGKQNVIQYIDITSSGNATDFGDLLASFYGAAGCSDATYGIIFAGNDEVQDREEISYITIATTGNATDFGDLTTGMESGAAAADATRGLHFGGERVDGTYYSNNIEYSVFLNCFKCCNLFGKVSIGSDSG